MWCVFSGVLSMWQKVKDYLGLTRDNEYIKNYFLASNMHASIYMSVIVIMLEIWMIQSMTEKMLRKNLPFWEVFRDYYSWYISLLLVGTVMLIFAILYLRGKFKNRLIIQAWLWLFSLLGLAFGIYFGYGAYIQDKQALSFPTMIIFILCLLVWKPLVSFVLSIGAYGIFYFVCDTMYFDADGTVIRASQSFQINLFTLFVSTFVVALAIYHQRQNEARKDEALEKVNKNLRKISVQDELTKISNMRGFKEAYKTMANIRGEDSTLLLHYFDFENYKAYNAKYGFEKGDELLQRFAEGLQRIFAPDPTARVSDDHFVGLCSEELSEERIQKTAELLGTLRGELSMELKTGICRIEGNDVNIDQACDKARLAAGSIKKMYDRSVREYDRELEESFYRIQYVINNIDKAVNEGYIKVFYQPVINAETGCLCGMEALARWDDPEYGMLAPYQFIGTLEEYRQIHKLDQQIIELVCRDMHELGDNPLAEIPVSINFSQLDFELYDVPEVLTEKTKKYGIPHDRIDVEITESALNGDSDSLIKTMEVIRGKGFSQWLDDFGSGYSSLNVLVDYNFDVLKIDMVFLRRFYTNEKSKFLIKSIIDLAKNLNMVTLTEGVETAEMADFLKEAGCDKLQGYYFSKPVPHERILELINEGKLTLPVKNDGKEAGAL